MNAKAKMQTMIEARTTDQLFADLEVLDSYRVDGFLPLEEYRMTHAMIADTIEARHGLQDAMEAIFEDMDYAGTYTEALRLAYVATGN